MAARNDVTGDVIQSRPSSEAYSRNYDNIVWGREAGVVGAVPAPDKPMELETTQPTKDYA